MTGLLRVLVAVGVSVPLASVATTGAQQASGSIEGRVVQGAGAIAGRVTDSSGGVLPGVVITLVGPSAVTVVTNAQGEYRFDNLLPGEYRLGASLTGFRTGGATVAVSAGATAKSDVTLRLGLLHIVDYAFPAGGVPGALREADVVVHVRLTRPVGVRLVNDIVIVTDHDATVLSVVKTDDAGIASGGSIRFAQDNSGRWTEDGYRAVGIERPYEPGESFVAFLTRQRDATLGEFRGAGYMWPVKQGFVLVANPAGALPPGLRAAMPVDEALAALRKLLSAK